MVFSFLPSCWGDCLFLTPGTALKTHVPAQIHLEGENVDSPSLFYLQILSFESSVFF